MFRIHPSHNMQPQPRDSPARNLPADYLWCSQCTYGEQVTRKMVIRCEAITNTMTVILPKKES